MTSWRIVEGDALERLRELPDESVQCCITSPPYYGLRDYGTGEWEGGEDGCHHRSPPKGGSHTASTLGPKRDGLGPNNAAWAESKREHQYVNVCGKCGARRTDRQLGLEPTPDEYVARLVEVFRQVRRVLRADGTVWLNMGDSYASGGMSNPSATSTLDGGKDRGAAGYALSRSPVLGCKPKDLLGIPWLLAFALRADGWYLRSDIIWSKPNPMPESVTDRPTSAHEHVFLLAKSARYFYDADAIREAVSPKSDFGNARPEWGSMPSTAPDDIDGGTHSRIRARLGNGSVGDPAGRNRRNVWEIATQPFSWKQNARQVRVEPDEADDDTKRITSPDCPVHGDRLARAATARDDGHGADVTTHSDSSDSCHAQASLDGLGSTAPHLALGSDADSLDSPRLADSQTASGHSTESRKTASSSASSDMASAETTCRTGDTSPSHGTPVPDDSGSPDSSQTHDRTAHKPACTCRYYRLEETDHFATFPTRLVEPCVLAGSSPMACGECGAPWKRVVEHEYEWYRELKERSFAAFSGNMSKGMPEQGHARKHVTTTGWQPSCPHDDNTGHSLILDPFAGTGTVGLVALRHGRNFTGIELSPAYCEMARNRIRQDAPLLNTPAETAA